jgi:hypothetical protein
MHAMRRGAHKSRSRHRKRHAKEKHKLNQYLDRIARISRGAFSAAIGKNLPGLGVFD